MNSGRGVPATHLSSKWRCPRGDSRSPNVPPPVDNPFQDGLLAQNQAHFSPGWNFGEAQLQIRLRSTEISGLPCLKIETWATQLCWSDAGHPAAQTHFASQRSLFQEIIAAVYLCLSGLSAFPYITKVTFSYGMRVTSIPRSDSETSVSAGSLPLGPPRSSFGTSSSNRDRISSFGIAASISTRLLE